MIYLNLFVSFLKIGLFSIGGGYAAIPLIQSQVVERYGWLTLSEFTDLITIAEMTPGPIIVNSATFVGMKITGIAGALITTAGSIFPSLFIVSLLAYLYYRYKNMSVMKSILSSLRPAIVALIASAGLSILINLVFGSTETILSGFNLQSVILLVLFAVAFAVIRKLKFSPVITMFGCGIIYAVINIIISHI